MTVAGISWIDVAFITKSIIMLSLALSLPLLIALIAFMPAGVATPPIPNMFAARFIEI